MPLRCPECRKKARDRANRIAEEKREEQYERERAARKAEGLKRFEEQLSEWEVVPFDSIHLLSEEALHVLGNGFDLMHGVRSDYYSFRDSLGKRSHLRHILENYFSAVDIWANLEDTLAHFKLDMMCGNHMMDTWLGAYEAYDEEEAGAAEYFMAIDSAINPMKIVACELPKRFRMWVETLKIGTKDRPLTQIFGDGNGKVISFNYTEFPEILYGFSEDHICYIHGCRKKKKGEEEKLILGHMPGESDDSYRIESVGVREDNPYNRAMVETAQDLAIQMVSKYDDEALTKKCEDIILAHKEFFAELQNIRNVVVIGHSLSPVDWDYFLKIKDSVSNINEVRWYVGSHGINDLKNLERLIGKMSVPRSSVTAFRTDDIKVTLTKRRVPDSNKFIPKEKRLTVSPDGAWEVVGIGQAVQINNLPTKQKNYEVVLHGFPAKAIFTPDGESLFVVARGITDGLFLFRIKNGSWKMVNEIESAKNQSVLNSRLKHIYMMENDVTFVYNNRVRKYSLNDGKLINNFAQRNAPQAHFEGKDIVDLFQLRAGRRAVPT